MGAGASEPASMSTTTAAVPTAEPAAEELASGGMPLFSLHRARSNVDELYYEDDTKEESKLAMAPPVVEVQQETVSTEMLFLHRARSNVDELYYVEDHEDVATAKSEPVVEAVIPPAEEEPTLEEPATTGLPLFSLHRARSNVDELYYQEQAKTGTSEPTVAAATEKEVSPEEAAPEGIVSGVNSSFLQRAGSNVDIDTPSKADVVEA